MDSDEQLVRRMLKGDEYAIDEFVKKYYPVILKYCRKRLCEFHLAEDVTQEKSADDPMADRIADVIEQKWNQGDRGIRILLTRAYGVFFCYFPDSCLARWAFAGRWGFYWRVI